MEDHGIYKSGHSFFLAARWDVIDKNKVDAYRNNLYSIQLDKRLDMRSFHNELMESGQWRLMHDVDDIASSMADGEPFEELEARSALPLYGEYCFYYNNIRHLLYNHKSTRDYLEHGDGQPPLAMVYEYNLDDRPDAAMYIYAQPDVLNNDENIRSKGIAYKLPLSALQLRVYATGVMFLSIHSMENLSLPELNEQNFDGADAIYHSVRKAAIAVNSFNLLKDGEFTDDIITIEDVARINYFGRGLFAPYLSKANGFITPLGQAPLISYLQLDNKVVICDYREPANYTKPEYLTFLKELLGPAFCGGAALSEYAKGLNTDTNLENLIAVSPFNDDRMYIQSYILDDKFSKGLQTDYPNRQYIVRGKRKGSSVLAKRFDDSLGPWYTFVMGDKSMGEPTCKDDEHFLMEVDNFTYTRWSEYGTFYGLSDKSMTMLAEAGAMGYLTDNFKWHYFSLFIIALLQDCSILRFYDEASGFVRAGNNNSCEAVRRRYMLFLNCIWQNNVTAQRQGAEIFHQLRENMHITNDVEFLDRALEEMHVAEMQREEDERNKLTFGLTIVGVVLALVGLVDLIYGESFVCAWFWPAEWGRVLKLLVSFLVCVLLALFAWSVIRMLVRIMRWINKR